MLAMAVFMPISCPVLSRSGPPELPGLIDASIWIKRRIVCSGRTGKPAVQTGEDAGRKGPFKAERVTDGVNTLPHL